MKHRFLHRRKGDEEAYRTPRRTKEKTEEHSLGTRKTVTKLRKDREDTEETERGEERHKDSCNLTSPHTRHFHRSKRRGREETKKEEVDTVRRRVKKE